jgi:hypothetical protein
MAIAWCGARRGSHLRPFLLRHLHLEIGRRGMVWCGAYKRNSLAAGLAFLMRSSAHRPPLSALHGFEATARHRGTSAPRGLG